MDHLRLVYEDDVLELFWDSAARYHIAEWHGFAKAERLRNAAHACVYASRERRSSLWLADIAGCSVIDADDQDWIVAQFYPLLVENGLRHMALVQPLELVAQLSSKRVTAAFGATGALEFAYHPSRADAACWLAGRRA